MYYFIKVGGWLKSANQNTIANTNQPLSRLLREYINIWYFIFKLKSILHLWWFAYSTVPG